MADPFIEDLKAQINYYRSLLERLESAGSTLAVRRTTAVPGLTGPKLRSSTSSASSGTWKLYWNAVS
jgi:hypothetical protein